MFHMESKSTAPRSRFGGGVIFHPLRQPWGKSDQLIVGGRLFLVGAENSAGWAKMHLQRSIVAEQLKGLTQSVRVLIVYIWLSRVIK